jgi:hypothetical protein
VRKVSIVTGTNFDPLQAVDCLAANSHSVYAGSWDMNFCKINGDAGSGFA